MAWLRRWRGRAPAAAPAPAVAPAAPPAPSWPALGPVDRDILVRTVWGEARGEPPEGQQAVVHVVRNRMLDDRRRWPRTAAAVCQQPAQFSAWNLDDVNRRRMEALTPVSPDYRRLAWVVDEAWRAEDSTGGANHYYAPAAMRGGRAPRWAAGVKPVAAIGGHLFFRL